ncbi:reverse transcriptase [Gossypium australe]|uniref:Reverse transcriptase n=1 Tax=Gossypium australe TaxID=47621 RepID=A0A5B6UG29_9ROSI|nr:reverse transcriptase [Gossypium australe]
MKSISWNVCGLGSLRATRRLRYFLKQQNPRMVFLMKTKIDKQRIERVRRGCGFLNGIEVSADGSRGGLCLAWKEALDVTLRSLSKNHIDVMIKEENSNLEWRFTGFYGSPYFNGKSESWNLLRKLGEDQSQPWLVKGDFNEIMYTFEKSGGVPREDKRMEAFREVLEECQLEDIGYSGVWFTWEKGNFANNNIRKRLDRGVAIDKWRSLFPTHKIFHLPHSISDHCPLLLNTEDENTQVGNTHFKFEAWWITEELLEKEIRDCWESKYRPNLRETEEATIKLRCSIKVKRAGLKKKLTKELEELMAKDSDDDTIVRIISTRVDLNMEIDRDEIYWE